MRKRMVTRTITITKAQVLAVDLASDEIKTVEVTITGEPKNEKALVKAISEVFDENGAKFVAVKSAEVSRVKYGMTEADFVKAAFVISVDGDADDFDDADANDEN